MENQNIEIKAKIKNYFVEINEDKFTQVRSVNCKQEIEWNGEETMRNRFMISSGVSHRLRLRIDYRHVENTDSVFFVFNYRNTGDGYPHMHDLKLYLIIDGNKNIELSDVSGHDTTATPYKLLDMFDTTLYVERAQVSVSTADFIQIANANKIEYSIRFGSGNLDGSFTESDLNIFKGFYNSTFDEDFEVEKLSSYIDSKTAEAEAKAKARAEAQANNSNSSGGGCYIATMAYGSYEHPQVMVLRDFRDNYLAKSNWGSKFITTYYKYSPKLVKHLKNKVLINRLVRGILNLFIKKIK